MEKRTKEPILVTYNYQAVHVHTNKTLVELLKKGVRHSKRRVLFPSYMYAKHIQKKHKEFFGEELRITTHSLGLEILIHTDAFLFCEAAIDLLTKFGLSREHKINRFLAYISDHAEIIDCGERIQDNNRFVFDWISLVWPIAYPFFRLLLFILPQPKKWKEE